MEIRKTKAAGGSMWGGNGFGTTYVSATYGVFVDGEQVGIIYARDRGFRETPEWHVDRFDAKGLPRAILSYARSFRQAREWATAHPERFTKEVA